MEDGGTRGPGRTESGGDGGEARWHQGARGAAALGRASPRGSGFAWQQLASSQQLFLLRAFFLPFLERQTSLLLLLNMQMRRAVGGVPGARAVGACLLPPAPRCCLSGTGGRRAAPAAGGRGAAAPRGPARPYPGLPRASDPARVVVVASLPGSGSWGKL